MTLKKCEASENVKPLKQIRARDASIAQRSIQDTPKDRAIIHQAFTNHPAMDTQYAQESC